MKKILLTLILISISFVYSQTSKQLEVEPEISYYLEPNVFTPEWKESLKEKINFITFVNSKNRSLIEFRIYRGDKEKYKVSIYDLFGKKFIECDLKQFDQINISELPNGIYFITAKDDDKNTATKIIHYSFPSG